MATVVRQCRVCGKTYEACAMVKRVDGVFRWQEVACSPDCGEAYLAAVIRGRSENKEQVIIDYPIIDADEDFEELYNEDEDEFEIEL